MFFEIYIFKNSDWFWKVGFIVVVCFVHGFLHFDSGKVGVHGVLGFCTFWFRESWFSWFCWFCLVVVLWTAVDHLLCDDSADLPRECLPSHRASPLPSFPLLLSLLDFMLVFKQEIKKEREKSRVDRRRAADTIRNQVPFPFPLLCAPLLSSARLSSALRPCYLIYYRLLFSLFTGEKERGKSRVEGGSAGENQINQGW